MTYNGYAMLLSGNTSSGKGGALAYNADTNTNFTHIERSLMVNNSATNGGGVYFAQPTINGSIHTTFELTDSTITGPGGVFLSLDSNERFRYLRNTFQNAGSIYFAGGGFMANNIVIGSTCSGNQNAGNYTGLRKAIKHPHVLRGKPTDYVLLGSAQRCSAVAPNRETRQADRCGARPCPRSPSRL